MAVNGIEIQVGQQWKTRGSDVVVIARIHDREKYPVEGTNGYTFTNGGHEYVFGDSDDDLVELLAPAPSMTGPATAPAAPSTNTSAPSILEKAAGHMRDRAATYDKPEGERSMAQTVAIFNLHHGTALTEAMGWHFMQVLKDVRLFTAKGYHADSAEDGVAYCGLKAEAKAREAT